VGAHAKVFTFKGDIRRTRNAQNSPPQTVKTNFLGRRKLSAGVSVARTDFEGVAMRTRFALAFMSLVITQGIAQAQSQDEQSVKVGPWTIATTYKADKFDNCTMTSSAEDLGISFVRNQDGLLLGLDSSKWKLERGKAYSVRLVAGSTSVGAKALAETKGVTIALADRPFNERLRTANVLEVRGEGATIHIPLMGSAAALERLEACFDKNQRESTETNPFVAPSRKP
jgi:hypothetical protein